MNAWNFAFITDIHLGTARSYRFNPSFNENWRVARNQLLELNPELMLAGGDMTRDGMNHRFELEQARDDFDQLPFPWRAIPGNHDIGNKCHPDSDVPLCNKYVKLYRSVFGPDYWSFRHRNVQFTGVNAFLAGSGLPEEDQMWQWLDAQKRMDDVDFHVWIMHPVLFLKNADDPNIDRREDLVSWYRVVDSPHRERFLKALKRTRADLLFTGHLHCRRETTWEGIRFVSAPSVAWGTSISAWPDGDPTQGFYNCRVGKRDIDVEFIPLREKYKLSGYGPSGNPPPESRDYTLAWEHPPLEPEEQSRPRGTLSGTVAGG